MGRKRLHDDPSQPLPPGLYRERKTFRARASSSDSWVYFGDDYETAIERFREWRGEGVTSTTTMPKPGAILTTLRKNAASRGLSVDLSPTDIEAMILRANGRCEVTGIAFSAEKNEGLRMRPWFPSVDRIERSKGYTKDNCRLVCAYTNLALNEFGEDAFARLARAFLRRRKDGRTPRSKNVVYERGL